MIDPKLLAGASILPLLVIGKLFEGLYLTTTKLYLISDKARILGNINAINLVGYLILGAIASHYFGLIGVAMTFLVSNILLFLATLKYYKKFENLLCHNKFN